MPAQSADSDFHSLASNGADLNSDSKSNRHTDFYSMRLMDLFIALGLLICFAWVYFESVPPSFNTRYENRRFFDSDGEFITRQFFQGKILTHNDHLLYHLLARGLYNLTSTPPVEPYDSVLQHRWLCITAGALGVAILFIFGKRLTGSTFGALAASLLIGGCAGWWFFSATIDTYLPHLVPAASAFAFALLALKRQKLSDYVYLGICMGLGFLFRTDGFLLVFLSVVAFADGGKRSGLRLVTCAASGAAVGLLGYAVLAHAFYDVKWTDVPSWAFSHTDRPGIKRHHWGDVGNIQPNSVTLTLANQFIYTVILPGLERTRTPNVFVAFNNNLGILLFYGILVLAAIVHLVRRRRWWWLALIAVTYISRTFLYTWWDPGEPFLFACLSLPALWVLVLDFVAISNSRYGVVRIGFVLFISVLIWWNNYHTMILPLRSAAG